MNEPHQQHRSKVNKATFKQLEALLTENQSYKTGLSAFKQLDECLQTYLSAPVLVTILKDWDYICHIRKILGIIVIKMIAQDVKTFEKQNMETRLWKVAYYDFYSILRSHCKSSSPHYLACKSCILQTITIGIQQFHEMLKAFQASTGISPIQLYERSLNVQSKNLSTIEHSSLMCAYKILIFLGDLHRYGSSQDEKKNMHNAARCYDQARIIIPEKSRAYHQLAILAKIKNDWINSSYNFLRAYTTSCETSRIDLLEIFDDVTKQFRAKENLFWHYRSRMNPGSGFRLVHNTIWITTDPNDRSIPPPPFQPAESKEDHLQNLTNQELYKRFCQSYIVFLGKLFTKIGLESLELVAESTLVYFEELLKRNVYISWIRLTQIVSLNLYMIRYINHKFKINPDTGWNISKVNRMKRSRAYKKPDRLDDAHHMESVAFDFGFEMFSLLVEKLTRIIRLCDWKNVMLGPLSIAVQLWISWLKHNSQFWAFDERSRPIFCVRRLMKSKSENARDRQDDVWMAFAELMNQLEILLVRFKTTFPTVKETQDETHSSSIGRLPECIYLAGFDLFAENKFMHREYFVQSKYDIDKAFLYVRFRRMYGFGKDVVKKVKILKRTPGFYKVNQYRSTAVIIQPNEETIKITCGLRENDYQLLLARFRRNLDLSASQMKGNKQKKLKRRKVTGDCNNARFIIRRKPKVQQAVEPTRARMANYEAWVLMAEFGFQTDLICCPKRVVLDTNCLINDLVYIDCLIPYLRHPLLIPVTVILELRGLAKGGLTNKEKKLFGSVHNPDAKDVVARNEKTAQNCKTALRFIEQHIGAFRIITSTGRYCNPDSLYDFMRDDYYDPDSSNDERILDSCKYMEYTDPETRPLDTPLRVFRNTILVSGDRILRLRTITLDIPTRTTASFTFWFFKTHNTSYRPRFKFGTKYPLSFQYSLAGSPRDEDEDYEYEEEDDSLLDKAALKKKRRAKKRGTTVELNPQMYRL